MTPSRGTGDLSRNSEPCTNATLRQFSGVELENADEVQLFRRSTPVFQLITDDDTVDLLAELPDMQSQPVVMPVLERRLDVDGLALITMEHAFTHIAVVDRRVHRISAA